MKSYKLKTIGLVCLVVMGIVLFCPNFTSARVVRDLDKIDVILLDILRPGEAMSLSEFFNHKELSQFSNGEIKETLEELEDQEIIVSFKEVYVRPRLLKVEDSIYQAVQDILGNTGFYYVFAQTVEDFKMELDKVKKKIIKDYKFTADFGENGLDEFLNFVFPKALRLYGDRLREMKRRLNRIIETGKRHRENLPTYWQTVQVEADDDFRARDSFSSQLLPNLTKIIEGLQGAMRNLPDYVDGLIFHGSWVSGWPRADSDVDLMLILKDTDSYEYFTVWQVISSSLGKEVQILREFTSSDLVYFWDIFGRKKNFIIIAKDTNTFNTILNTIYGRE